MSTCKDLDRLLEQRLLGTLNRDEDQALWSHVEECASCRSRVAADDVITRALVTMPTVPCPARVVDAIKAATVRPPAPARRSRRLPQWPAFGWKPAWAGMAAACACLVVALVSRTQRNDLVPFHNDPGSVEAASAVVKWSLVYTAQTIQTSQTRVVHQTMAGGLPRSVHSALSRVPMLKGVTL